MAALSKRQFDIAYRARFQALNAQLYRLATNAQDQVEADRRYLRRFDKRGRREDRQGRERLAGGDRLILTTTTCAPVSGAEIDRAAAGRAVEAAMLVSIDLPDAVRQNLGIRLSDELARTVGRRHADWSTRSRTSRRSRSANGA